MKMFGFLASTQPTELNLIALRFSNKIADWVEQSETQHCEI